MNVVALLVFGKYQNITYKYIDSDLAVSLSYLH